MNKVGVCKRGIQIGPRVLPAGSRLLASRLLGARSLAFWSSSWVAQKPKSAKAQMHKCANAQPALSRSSGRRQKKREELFLELEGWHSALSRRPD